MFRQVLVLISLIILISVAGGCANEPEKKPEAQREPRGYTTLRDEALDNPHQNGCASCHRKTEDVDRSLPAYVERIEGHPEVKEATVKACYDCHEAEKDYELYKKFYCGIHQSHWLSETFYSANEGRCSSCHTVEKNGVSGIKDYPLAGYRTLNEKAAPEKANPAPAPVQEKQKPVKKEPQQKPEQEQEEERQEELPQQQPTEGEQEQIPTPGP